MPCISTASFSVKFNGMLHGFLGNKRESKTRGSSIPSDFCTSFEICHKGFEGSCYAERVQIPPRMPAATVLL